MSPSPFASVSPWAAALAADAERVGETQLGAALGVFHALVISLLLWAAIGHVCGLWG